MFNNANVSLVLPLTLHQSLNKYFSLLKGGLISLQEFSFFPLETQQAISICPSKMTELHVPQVRMETKDRWKFLVPSLDKALVIKPCHLQSDGTLCAPYSPKTAVLSFIEIFRHKPSVLVMVAPVRGVPASSGAQEPSREQGFSARSGKRFRVVVSVGNPGPVVHDDGR